MAQAHQAHLIVYEWLSLQVIVGVSEEDKVCEEWGVCENTHKDTHTHIHIHTLANAELTYEHVGWSDYVR